MREVFCINYERRDAGGANRVDKHTHPYSYVVEKVEHHKNGQSINTVAVIVRTHLRTRTICGQSQPQYQFARGSTPSTVCPFDCLPVRIHTHTSFICNVRMRVAQININHPGCRCCDAGVSNIYHRDDRSPRQHYIRAPTAQCRVLFFFLCVGQSIGPLLLAQFCQYLPARSGRMRCADNVDSPGTQVRNGRARRSIRSHMALMSLHLH